MSLSRPSAAGAITMAGIIGGARRQACASGSSGFIQAGAASRQASSTVAAGPGQAMAAAASRGGPAATRIVKAGSRAAPAPVPGLADSRAVPALGGRRQDNPVQAAHPGAPAQAVHRKPARPARRQRGQRRRRRVRRRIPVHPGRRAAETAKWVNRIGPLKSNPHRSNQPCCLLLGDVNCISLLQGCGRSSAGRASDFQSECHEFEPRRPLHITNARRTTRRRGEPPPKRKAFSARPGF